MLIDRQTRRWFEDHDLDLTGLTSEEANEIRQWWTDHSGRLMTKVDKQAEEHAQ